MTVYRSPGSPEWLIRTRKSEKRIGILPDKTDSVLLPFQIVPGEISE